MAAKEKLWKGNYEHERFEDLWKLPRGVYTLEVVGANVGRTKTHNVPRVTIKFILPSKENIVFGLYTKSHYYRLQALFRAAGRNDLSWDDIKTLHASDIRSMLVGTQVDAEVKCNKEGTFYVGDIFGRHNGTIR